MTSSIGTDILSKSRILSIKSSGKWLKFTQRILSSEEYLILNTLAELNKANYVSKRFCAKEAISKALKHGIGQLKFSDISILNDSNGAPFVKIRNINRSDIMISISDEKEYCVAFALIV